MLIHWLANKHLKRVGTEPMLMLVQALEIITEQGPLFHVSADQETEHREAK